MTTKRFLQVAVLFAVLILLIMDASAVTRGPERNTTRVTFAVDSTDLDKRDTITTDANGNKLFRINCPTAMAGGEGGYAKLDGWIGIYYVSVDTGTTGAKVDTTKDTVAVDVMTFANSGKPYKVLQTLTFVPAGALTAATLTSGFTALGAGSYQQISVPTDSTLFDYVCLRFRTYCSDSLNTKARLAAKIHYGVHAWLKIR